MKPEPVHSTRVHPSLDDLVRLQFDARGFSFLPRQPVHSLLSGRHASRLRGRGLQFEEMRGYRAGDDIRSIDWRATARLRKTHVRVYSEERERPVLLVVDQRSTMFFGSARTTKATAAAELAALAAWRTLAVGDRVGAILFNNEEVVQIKPHRSRSNVLRICHELVKMNADLSASESGADDTMLNEALRRAVKVAHHDYLVVLITDYHGDDQETRRLATTLAAHNDVIAVLVYDPLGARLPVQAGMEATDGKERLTIPESARFASHYEKMFTDRLAHLREELRALRIPILPICTHDPVPEQVLAAMGHRP
jgi:uncharacterized protein (DUF58 family)